MKSSEGFFNLGDASFRRSEFEEAIAAYHKVITLNPSNSHYEISARNLPIAERSSQTVLET
ncbi:MAG: tetratricopeptide repeat protein [Phormidesmis sp.]